MLAKRFTERLFARCGVLILLIYKSLRLVTRAEHLSECIFDLFLHRLRSSRPFDVSQPTAAGDATTVLPLCTLGLGTGRAMIGRSAKENVNEFRAVRNPSRAPVTTAGKQQCSPAP